MLRMLNMRLIQKNDEQNLFAAVTKPEELQNWEVADSYTIRRGNYDKKNNIVNN